MENLIENLTEAKNQAYKAAKKEFKAGNKEGQAKCYTIADAAQKAIDLAMEFESSKVKKADMSAWKTM